MKPDLVLSRPLPVVLVKRGPVTLHRVDYKRGSVWELLFNLKVIGKLWAYVSWGKRHWHLSFGWSR